MKKALLLLTLSLFGALHASDIFHGLVRNFNQPEVADSLAREQYSIADIAEVANQAPTEDERRVLWDLALVRLLAYPQIDKKMDYTEFDLVTTSELYDRLNQPTGIKDFFGFFFLSMFMALWLFFIAFIFLKVLRFFMPEIPLVPKHIRKWIFLGLSLFLTGKALYHITYEKPALMNEALTHLTGRLMPLAARATQPTTRLTVPAQIREDISELEQELTRNKPGKSKAQIIKRHGGIAAFYKKLCMRLGSHLVHLKNPVRIVKNDFFSSNTPNSYGMSVSSNTGFNAQRGI